MTDIFCSCLIKAYVNIPGTLWSTVLELLFSIMIGICGLIINYRFLTKLKEEKRNVPLHRKGNVIEPIMSWFCKLQMIYWPYHLLLFWIAFNEIIPGEYMNGWWCAVATQIGIIFGRMCIAWNSIFVALIRYIYIVHHKKSNQWEFKKVGRYFQILSIAIPFGVETIGLFVKDYSYMTDLTTINQSFRECIAYYQGSNTTHNLQIPNPYPLEWTLQIIPEWIINSVHYVYVGVSVVILCNLTEGILYLLIFRSITRYICKGLNSL